MCSRMEDDICESISTSTSNTVSLNLEDPEVVSVSQENLRHLARMAS